MENSIRTMLYRSFFRFTISHLLVFSVIACLLLLPSLLFLKIPVNQQYAYASAQQTNLSNSGNSDFSRIVASGNNVYVAWSNLTSNQIEFKASSDGGSSFGPTIQITNSSSQVFGQFSLSAGSSPSQSGTTNNVYIVWSDGYQNTGNHAVLLARSTDGGNSFEPAVNLSNDTGDSFVPRVASPDDGSGNVYVVWADNVNGTCAPCLNDIGLSYQIFFKKSTDGGKTFGTPIGLSKADSETADIPQIAVSGSHVYTIWGDDESGNISGRSSANNGSSWGNEVNISNGVGSFGASESNQVQNLAAFGNKEYVVWNAPVSGAQGQIYMANSTNGGDTFGTPINLSNDNGIQSGTNCPKISVSPAGDIYVVWPDFSGPTSQIFERSVIGGTLRSVVNLSNSSGIATDSSIITSNNGRAYVVWSDDFASPGSSQVYSIEIAGSGSQFNGPVGISNNSGVANHPQVTSSSNNVLISWSDNSAQGGSSSDILFEANPSYLVPKIFISHISDTSPIWGAQVSASGTVLNTIPGESVIVDWGDGSSPSTGIAIASGSWGPVSHTYSSSAIATNPNNIVAKLVNSTDSSVLAQAAPSPVTVEKHNTTLFINTIPSVKQGTAVTVTGSLVDADANASAVAMQNITFIGSGASGLGSTTTAINGSFTSSGSSQNQQGDGWVVSATFAGNSTYNPSTSSMTYDTALTSSRTINVPSGSNVNINLTTTAFKSFIKFDQVSHAGVLYVSDCTAADTARFLAIADLCVSVAPDLLLSPGTSAHIQISYSGKTLPAPHTASDLDLFQVESAPSSKIIDITESRDLVSHTVTGSTKSFSSFVAAVAIHATPTSDAIVKQIYAGESVSTGANTIAYRSLAGPSVALDKVTYSVGQVATITVTDLNANTNNSKIETVTANISSTGSPSKLTLGLTETGSGTGIFTAHFTIVSDATSNATKSLKVQSGGKITVSYLAVPRAALQAVFNKVNESGIVTIRDFTIDQNGPFVTPFIPVGKAVNMTVQDAKLASGGYTNITMSYASDFRGANNGTNICVFQFQPLVGWKNISYHGASGHDLAAQTSTGRTSVLGGEFTLGLLQVGCELGTGGGGGGGGVSLPGSGIFVDFVATIASDSSSSGGSSSGSHSGSTSQFISSSSGTQVTTSGANSATTVTVPLASSPGASATGSITLAFHSVSSSGSVSATLVSLQSLSNKLVNASSNQPMISLPNGLYYTATGPAIDIITSSDLKFSGPIDVTVTFDPTLLKQYTSPETMIRLVHFNGASWEDDTTKINFETGTITGTLHSLSPVMVALSTDGTFGPVWFQNNPLYRIIPFNVDAANYSDLLDGNQQPISENRIVTSGEQITIHKTLKNVQQVTQSFTLVVEVIDQNGFTSGITYLPSTLSPGESIDLHTNWTANDTGKYNIKLLVLDDLSKPSLLSDPSSRLITLA